MGTGTKIALVLGGIAVVSVGAYFIYKSVKKKREEKAMEQKAVTSASLKPIKLIPNTQPKGFGAQSGGLSNLNLIDKSKYGDVFSKDILANKSFVYDATKPFGGLNTTWKPKPSIF
jgi:hypothetical protein